MQYLDVAAILKSYTTKLHFSEFKVKLIISTGTTLRLTELSIN